jgi:transcriptional regulator with XRE-family HTH domain
MTGKRDGTVGIGKRIAAYRKLLGMASSKDLADAIPNEKMTESVIQNIESGRKSDLAVSQLLEISRALGISPALLLAPIARPNDTIDLPNLSDAVASMSVYDFQSWLTLTDEDRTGDGPSHITLRHIYTNTRRLVSEVRAWESVSVDPSLRSPAPESENPDTTVIDNRAWAERELLARQESIDLLVENLTKYNVDVSWVQRPWRESADG